MLFQELCLWTAASCIAFPAIDDMKYGAMRAPVKCDLDRPCGVLRNVCGELAEDEFGRFEIAFWGGRRLDVRDELVPRDAGGVPVVRIERPAPALYEVEGQDRDVGG